MDVGWVPGIPTGIVRYEGALYVSAHPSSASEKEHGQDADTPRGIFRLRPSVAPGGCAAELLTRCGYPRILAVDADYTWTLDGLLRRGSREGGEELTVPYFSMPHWLALDGDDVFISDLNWLAVLDRRSPLTGDEKVDGLRTLSKDGCSRRVAVHGEDVFHDSFVYPNPEEGCRIVATPRRGGRARVLAEVDRETIDLGVVGDHVVIGPKDGPLLRVPRKGGKLEAIEGSACGGWFVAREGALAWFDEEASTLFVLRDGRMVRRALAHGRRASPTSLLIDDGVAFYGAKEPDDRGRYAIVALALGS
jgi:hypothetical protein